MKNASKFTYMSLSIGAFGATRRASRTAVIGHPRAITWDASMSQARITHGNDRALHLTEDL